MQGSTRIWKVLIWKVRDEIGKLETFRLFGKNQCSWKAAIEVGKILFKIMRERTKTVRSKRLNMEVLNRYGSF